ncbi:hypothetical protein [Rickettsia prowazekii]|nr:hypothetical protein [Rickettsia prowazekii]AFE49852.1 hypothetical protein M9Y_00910 [Rickettsia prowazekii str. Katsinyian]AFE50696.1 hypothetical protein MA1_00900 [Rickettsia prowazekii str. BuV67-CWPP]AFE51536.1 hypothetical protein MA3_00915 [Rickettsia prowazekii str. Dachau]
MHCSGGTITISVSHRSLSTVFKKTTYNLFLDPGNKSPNKGDKTGPHWNNIEYNANNKQKENEEYYGKSNRY